MQAILDEQMLTDPACFESTYWKSTTAYSRSENPVQKESNDATVPRSEDRPCYSSESKDPESSARVQLDGCLRTQTVRNVHSGSGDPMLTCALPVVDYRVMVPSDSSSHEQLDRGPSPISGLVNSHVNCSHVICSCVNSVPHLWSSAHTILHDSYITFIGITVLACIQSFLYSCH